jgi:F0F1-type ATP synthase membrane subunit b/b'
MAVAKKEQINAQESIQFGDSLLNSWNNSLNLIYDFQKEVENVSLQSLGYQKEVLEKVTNDYTRIEGEQKKLVDELREVVKQNIQTVYGEEASGSFERWNEHFDEVSSRVQQLTVAPLKEGLNILNQSQENFQESIKKSVDQQQNIRQNFLKQIKTAQKGFIDLVESNTKLALSFYK